MSDIKIPEGYQQVMLYLIIQNAAAFMDFMMKVFDAKEKYKVMRDEHTIMHGEVSLGECTVMFAESTDAYSVQNAGLFIYVANADETFQKALDAGATEVMPVSDQSYGRSGGVKDPFGNTWWVTSVG